jgi:hypothetical protein
MAFILIEKTAPLSAVDTVPLIEQSSIYIAWKSDHFRPVRLNVRSVSIGGRQWRIFREPSLSPDLKTVYFEVANTVTTWTLMRCSLRGDSLMTINRVVAEYCVLWGGAHSSDLLVMERHDASRGVIYPCYLIAPSGHSALLDDGSTHECWPFGEFAKKWTSQHGGACPGWDVE